MTAGLTRGRPKLWNCSPQIALSRLGEERELKAPVTLPKLTFTAGHDDIKEAAERIATTRIIRAGRDAWEEIGRAEGFEAWKLIGKALAVGKPMRCASPARMRHGASTIPANSANG
jgi:hypothetical protein